MQLEKGVRGAGEAGMERCRAVYYTGSVQGVGFRFTARGLAQRYAVTGYVRNLSDGRVEVMAFGEEEEVKGYLEALRESMGEYIADEEANWIQPPERFVTFDIRF
jgi:acylphosphatase